ncbi:MAG: MerR family transcriptional regulator [Candidatus Marinimicrobia bacterium]|nr:MerR family transcriptional regulator [Candidatus Neomarinimicrobiota bacterium]
MRHKGIKKLYYSISEVSEMLGIKQSVIRYWEGEFKILNPQKNRAGNRIYKKDDIPVLRLIHYYVHGKHLSIQETREMINHLKKEGLYQRKVDELTALAETGEKTGRGTGRTERVQEEEKEEERKEEKSAGETSSAEGTEEGFSEKETGEEAEDDKEPAGESIEEDILIFPADEEVASRPEVSPEKAASKEAPEEAEKGKAAEREEAPQVKRDENKAMRELLQKISRNIRDIIDILNEK